MPANIIEKNFFYNLNKIIVFTFQNFCEKNKKIFQK